MASSDLNLEIYKDVKEDLIAKIMDDFEGLLEIDKNLSGRTVKQHTRNIERFLKSVDKPLAKIGKKDIRNWLRKWKEDYAPSTYANKVKSLRVFFRDHLGSDIAENLSMPQPQPNNDSPPSKDDIQKLYESLDSVRDRTALLMFATTGLRRNELFSLITDDIDFDKRMIVPGKNLRTKRSYVTFYNEEAERHLEKHLSNNDDGNEIFSIRARSINRIFLRNLRKDGIENISPQDLRKWFAKEMRDEGVSGEHIDAFCGRLPRSVRGKHYTDYSPSRLKEIYEKADIKVLEGK